MSTNQICPGEERTPSVRPAVVQFPLRFNFVGKGSDARPSQSELSLVQLPLLNYVGKGSDAYQTRYRNTNENIVYIGWFVPPLERLERREEPEAQGGEFVEADDCK